MSDVRKNKKKSLREYYLLERGLPKAFSKSQNFGRISQHSNGGDKLEV